MKLIIESRKKSKGPHGSKLFLYTWSIRWNMLKASNKNTHLKLQIQFRSFSYLSTSNECWINCSREGEKKHQKTMISNEKRIFSLLSLLNNNICVIIIFEQKNSICNSLVMQYRLALVQFHPLTYFQLLQQAKIEFDMKKRRKEIVDLDCTHTIIEFEVNTRV